MTLIWSPVNLNLLLPAFCQVSVDKLYMSAVNHVFERSMKPLLLEQHKRRQKHTSSKETFKVAKTIMGYIHCIQNPEWAAATAHKIAQELPPGQTVSQSHCHATVHGGDGLCINVHPIHFFCVSLL